MSPYEGLPFYLSLHEGFHKTCGSRGYVTHIHVLIFALYKRYVVVVVVLMHLSMLCPTPPLPGYRGEMVGHLTCFDTKNCPIHGEFDRQPYVCAIIISTDSQISHLFLDF